MSRLKHLVFPIVGVSLIASLVMFTHTGNIRAADHGDSPAPGTASGDIADHYAWMTEDGSKLVMVMTLASGFQSGLQYVFHINSMANYGATTSTSNIILCTVSPTGTNAVECFVSNDNSTSGGTAYQARVAGDRGTDLGDASFKAHAGNFDDPFFFNGAGFGATVEAVLGVAASLEFDKFGCPTVDSGTSTTLVTQLGTAVGGGTAVDSFAGGNIDAIVIEIDKEMINEGGEILATHSSVRSGS